MPTITLTPTSYTKDSAVTVTNAARMYTDTASTTYATLTHAQESTTYYYLYLKGFGKPNLPEGAVVSSFTAKIKVRAEAGASSAAVYLKGNTSSTFSPSLGTTRTTTSILSNSYAWDTVSSAALAGALEIRIPVRRTSATVSTQSYVYVYGAEIVITYSIPSTDALYFRDNGAWVEASKAYKKASGVWVEQTDMTTVFDAGKSWVKG